MMKFKRRLFIFLVACLLVICGCVSSPKIVERTIEEAIVYPVVKLLIPCINEKGHFLKAGSGVIIYQRQKEVYGITVKHLFRTIDGETFVVYAFPYGNISQHMGKILAQHPERDIVFFKFESKKNLPVAHISSRLVIPFKKYRVVGCPLGLPPTIMDDGYVSNYPCPISVDQTYLITAYACDGVSGGGVFDDRFELVGIVQGVTVSEGPNGVPNRTEKLSWFLPLAKFIDWLAEEVERLGI